MPKDSDNFFWATVGGAIFMHTVVLLAYGFSRITRNQCENVGFVITLWMIGNLAIGIWYYGYGPFKRSR